MSRVRSKKKVPRRGVQYTLGGSALAVNRPSKIRTQAGTAGRRELSSLARASALPRRESASHDLSRERRRRFLQASAGPLQKPAIIGKRAARLAERDSLFNARVASFTDVCARRKKRREVIHATGRAGKNVVRKMPKFTWRSLVKCKKG